MFWKGRWRKGQSLVIRGGLGIYRICKRGGRGVRNRVQGLEGSRGVAVEVRLVVGRELEDGVEGLIDSGGYVGRGRES